MSHFTRTACAAYAGSRLSEGAIELCLTAAAAVFTAAMWLSIASVTITPDRPIKAAAAQESAVTRVTLPTVVIVGRREALEGTPIVTTAENTAAIAVTLKQ